MMELQYQQHTEAKIRWAVKCYNDWHEMRLDRVDYEEEIYEADLGCPEKLTKKNFEFVHYV